MTNKKLCGLIILGIVIFTSISFAVCSFIFPGTVILKNTHNLTMKVWLLEERGVIVNSKDPKTMRVYKFMIVSDHELQKESEDDALWETKVGLYFRLTDTKPAGA